MRFHIHRWHTVREVDWATWSREYWTWSVPLNPFPPSLEYGGVITGVALKECRCGGRSHDLIKGSPPPSNTWDRGEQ